jgi:hypothetical protein
MKTQEQIDKIRRDYEAQWALDVRRMEAKRLLYQSSLDAVIEAMHNPAIRIMPEPGELFPGDRLRTLVGELEENIAARKVQFELVQDEFDACDRVRATPIQEV